MNTPEEGKKGKVAVDNALECHLCHKPANGRRKLIHCDYCGELTCRKCMNKEHPTLCQQCYIDELSPNY